VEDALVELGIGEDVEPVAVVDGPPLARLLGERRAPLVAVPARGRAPAASTTLPVDAASLAALVGVEPGRGGAWDTVVAAWTGALRDGGALVVVERAPREEAARRALAAGLVEIAQRAAGRHVITSGRVVRW
jgi:hypothetical protein